MVVMNVKFNRKTAITAFAVIIAVIIIAVILVSNIKKTDKAISKDHSLSGATTEERQSFLLSYGYKVKDEESDIHDVVIPYNFDATYEQYNTLQKAQGFNLKDYKGMRATEYSYEIENYDGYDGIVYGHLLVCDNEIIGGDIASAELNGFMHTFDKETYLGDEIKK